MNIEIKKITNIDDSNLKIMTEWMYNWWGKEEGHTQDAIKCFLIHHMEENRIPQTYGCFHEGKIIGMYQFSYDDLTIRPDIYPWLCNVYVDEKYRGMGISRKMLETVLINAKKTIKEKELYLYTKHIGLYEKFGWEFIEEIDTYNKNPRIQRLYKISW